MIKLRLSCFNNIRWRGSLHNNKGVNSSRGHKNSKCLCTYNRELKYMRQRTQNYKEKFTIIWLYSDFNTPLSIIDRTSRQIISKETDPNKSIYYLNLTFIDHPPYSSGIIHIVKFTKIDHIWIIKQFQYFNNAQIIKIKFSELNKIELVTNNRKAPNIQKLNTIGQGRNHKGNQKLFWTK